MPLLLGSGLTDRGRDSGVFPIAGPLTVLLPFVAAVMATRSGRFGPDGAYVVLTLLMVPPAVGITQLG